MKLSKVKKRALVLSICFLLALVSCDQKNDIEKKLSSEPSMKKIDDKTRDIKNNSIDQVIDDVDKKLKAAAEKKNAANKSN